MRTPGPKLPYFSAQSIWDSTLDGPSGAGGPKPDCHNSSKHPGHFPDCTGGLINSHQPAAGAANPGGTAGPCGDAGADAGTSGAAWAGTVSHAAAGRVCFGRSDE